jgi:hypothetical protein
MGRRPRHPLEDRQNSFTPWCWERSACFSTLLHRPKAGRPMARRSTEDRTRARRGQCRAATRRVVAEDASLLVLPKVTGGAWHGNLPGQDCPILRGWRGGLCGDAPHRAQGLAQPGLSHSGTKMGQFRPDRHAIQASSPVQSERRRPARGPAAGASWRRRSRTCTIRRGSES